MDIGLSVMNSWHLFENKHINDKCDYEFKIPEGEIKAHYREEGFLVVYIKLNTERYFHKKGVVAPKVDITLEELTCLEMYRLIPKGWLKK